MQNEEIQTLPQPQCEHVLAAWPATRTMKQTCEVPNGIPGGGGGGKGEGRARASEERAVPDEG